MNTPQRRPGTAATILMGLLLAMQAASGSIALQVKGQPKLNVFFSKGFSDAAWQKAAFDRVAKVWVAAAPPALGKKSVVIATVNRDGAVGDTKMNLESGSADWDKAALAAVKKAAPFPALPRSWTPATTEVHFHFEFAKP